MFDREVIFHWILNKQWDELLAFVHQNPEAASADEVIQHAIKTFMQQFMANVETESDSPQLSTYLEKIVLLHKMGKFAIAEEDYKVVVVELVRRHSDNLSTAYHYARLYPQHELCTQVIEQYEASVPKVVPHSQSQQVRVTENANIGAEDYTTTLFKSQQEYEFFLAVREVFPNYAVHPNVALSCLIDFDKIKPALTTAQRKYFFQGIVDCVVFDQYRGHKPICFFELDSAYHDGSEQQTKDECKDHILALAGQKLYRVRKYSSQIDQSDFVKMIREVIKEL